ncbi:MAG: hypothetical protein LBH70_09515 [Spirochaetaceae bacterium]|jgi:hypothetical protein|nr:hypothetical protein [Spirochaetaceae bacterium]
MIFEGVIRMKHRFLIALMGIIVAVLPLAAQEQTDRNKSEYYYVNTTVEKIYPYRKGYVVQYRKGPVGVARIYLPIEWFSDAAGKAEIIPQKAGRDWPSMSIYYKNGEFSHVRLYTRPFSHESWGNIPLNVNLDSYFENVNDVQLEY